MSQAMQLCGYGALPGGQELIRNEQAKEAVKEVTITPEDFAKALEQRWHIHTCLLAQCAIRHGLKRENGDPDIGLLLRTPMGKKIAAIFDQERAVYGRGIEGSPRLRWLRESLPITIKL